MGALAPDERTPIRAALLEAREFIAGVLEQLDQVPQESLALLVKVDRAIGRTLVGTMFHDRGAFARCSFCQRYSADPRTITEGHSPSATFVPVRCDCGRTDGWSGSFSPPGPGAQWSASLTRRAHADAGEAVKPKATKSKKKTRKAATE